MISTRVVFTGAPSTGKSTVLQFFQKIGFTTFDEVARLVIQESIKQNSAKVPWDDLLGFSQDVIEKQWEQHQNHANQLANNFSFYDRGIPDVFAYLNKGEVLPTASMLNYLNEIKYCPKVFLFPLWEEIYANDLERKEDWMEAKSVQNHLIKIYSDLGYQLIKVPKLEVSERVEFILNELNTIK